jgi:hypothetical protein
VVVEAILWNGERNLCGKVNLLLARIEGKQVTYSRVHCDSNAEKIEKLM